MPVVHKISHQHHGSLEKKVKSNIVLHVTLRSSRHNNQPALVTRKKATNKKKKKEKEYLIENPPSSGIYATPQKISTISIISQNPTEQVQTTDSLSNATNFKNIYRQKSDRKKRTRSIWGRCSYVYCLWFLPCLILLGACIAAIILSTITTPKVTTTTKKISTFSTPCVNGIYTVSNTCNCSIGWNGSTCATAICNPSCQNNGTCSTPNTCTCTSQWNGSTCAIPVCNPSCQNNGTCSAPNTCTCTSQWNGSTCATPICNQSCQNNGTCSAPNTCTCTSQWNGSTCATPICNPSCQNNGKCIAPNICNCTSSWNGSFCEIPICNPSCLNGGTCTSPNNCTCDTSTWIGDICQTPVRIFWSVDGNLLDLYNNFNGIGVNSPSYQSPGYNGAGSCLNLTRSMNQSVIIPIPPFLNMAYTSFTLEVWMYARTLCTGSPCSDNAIFGQCQNITTDECLHITVRSERMYFAFFLDDLQGNQILSTNQWYHLGYIYDYASKTQYVYVNGYLDTSRATAGPYKGATGALTIGTNAIFSPNNYFDGCLDSIAYFGRAKNATEVLFDATLVAYLSFDNNTLVDSGPLLINGTGTNYSYTSSGRRNACLTLQIASSYVQISGLRRMGTNSWPYSLAIWINPVNISGGSIIHMSSLSTGVGSWCALMMGLTSAGYVAINSWSGVSVPITGPTVPLNTWTHVAGTYSSTNGERLYVNGTLINSTAPYTFLGGGSPMIITLGSSLLGISGCITGTMQTGQFYGSLDEFYVYARELTASEVAALANI